MAVRFDTEGEGYVGTTGLPADTFTVTWWAYISVNRATYSAFLSFDSADSYTEINLAADGLTPWVFNSAAETVQGTSQLVPGQWYAMAFVRDMSAGDPTGPGTLSWGTDPTDLTSVTGQVAPHTVTNFRIGHFKDTGEWLNGRMAAVKLWNAALSEAQVQAELQTYDPVITADLVRVHKLRVPEILDYSGNGYHLTGGAGATTEGAPPITDPAAQEPGRFLLAYQGVGATAETVLLYPDATVYPSTTTWPS